jgi:hypothetical protein
MTEAEWLACTDSTAMLEFIRLRASERKMRLVACACCRRIWHLLIDARSRQAVEDAESHVDGLINRDRLIQTRDDAREAKRQFMPPAQVVAWRAACAAQDVTRDTGRSAASNCVAETARAMNIRDTNCCDPAELQQQAAIFRCIFGNPFYLVTLDPTWRRWNDGTLVKLAESIYQNRAFDRLAFLADTLEEAGFHDAEFLGHCRQPSSHVRGCWVVDALLGKE